VASDSISWPKLPLTGVHLGTGTEAVRLGMRQRGDARLQQVAHFGLQRAYRQPQLGTLGNDVGRLAGFDRADGHDGHVKGIHVARHHRLQRHHHRRAGHHRIDRTVRNRAVATAYGRPVASRIGSLRTPRA
jgi:hypothetical protein